MSGSWVFETLVVVVLVELMWLAFLVEPYLGLR